MTEQMVQVPVSLIERAERRVRAAGFIGLADELAALLSQPPSIAEPVTRQQRAQEVIDRNERDRLRSAPPRIEDMAPGTTFTARQFGGHWLRLVRVVGGVATTDEPHVLVADIDPSTIRDVTPPSTESTK